MAGSSASSIGHPLTRLSRERAPSKITSPAVTNPSHSLTTLRPSLALEGEIKAAKEGAHADLSSPSG